MRRMRGPTHSPRSGFTLLEVLATVIFFTLAFVTLMQVFSAGMRAATDVESEDLALNIAQAKMEELRDASFAGLASSGPTADGNFPSYNVTVSVTGTDPKQIDVTVDWNVQGGSTNVVLSTLRANY